MKRLVAALAVCFLLQTASAEDVLVLANGREARGTIVEETAAGVKLDVGAGRLFYPRDSVKEIRRGSTEVKTAPVAAAPAPEEARDDFALLYDDGRRVGTRTVRTSKTPTGFKFEEEVVLFDEKGEPVTRTHVTEKCDPDFNPQSFLLRESSGESEHRMVQGEVRGGRLYVTSVKRGEKTLRDDALPTPESKFPFAARELFLRESKALGGKLSTKAFDFRDELWRTTSYVEGGEKPVVEDGQALTFRVVLRKRGDVAEREWVDAKLVAHFAELDGEKLRALGSAADVVSRVKKGDGERATGPASAARTRYVDPDAGFRIGKPDPSWTFETPTVRGAGALLCVRNAPVFASVDVIRDVAAPADDTVERAAETLQRACRAVAPDFKVGKDGYVGEGAARVYWLEATATTKGERTKTLARVVVRKGATFRLLAACPEGAFEALRPDFEKILGSFAAE